MKRRVTDLEFEVFFQIDCSYSKADHSAESAHLHPSHLVRGVTEEVGIVDALPGYVPRYALFVLFGRLRGSRGDFSLDDVILSS